MNAKHLWKTGGKKEVKKQLNVLFCLIVQVLIPSKLHLHCNHVGSRSYPKPPKGKYLLECKLYLQILTGLQQKRDAVGISSCGKEMSLPLFVL